MYKFDLEIRSGLSVSCLTQIVGWKKITILFTAMSLLEGGADTGFKRVLPEAYEPRLFVVQKGADKKITCSQIELKRGNLSSDNVYIIDNGLNIYQVCATT